MNEAPERICTSQCGKTIVQDGMKRFETDVEYIRSDVAQAMVAAACEGLVDQAAGMADGRDEARYIEDQMREAIPGASRSALHALLKAEREKALRVKPLEWLGDKTHGSMYDYRIYGVRRGRGGGFSSVFLERDQWGSRVQIAKCIPEETAKAAAQADYEARILAMIEGDVSLKAKKPNLVGTGVQVGLLKNNPAG